MKNFNSTARQVKKTSKKEQLAERIAQEKQMIQEIIISREYTQKELEAIAFYLEKGKQEEAKKILTKGCYCQQNQLTKFIEQELNNQEKTKEAKVEAILSFCLDKLNQGVTEEWKKRKLRAELLTTLAEHEVKTMKKEMFKDYINREIIRKMDF